MNIMKYFDTIMIIFIIAIVSIAIIANIIIVKNLKFPKISSIVCLIVDRIKLLIGINVASVKKIFKLFDDMIYIDRVFVNSDQSKRDILTGFDADAALNLATTPLYYAEILDDEEKCTNCTDFSYIQKLLILHKIRCKDIDYPGTIHYIRYSSDFHIESRHHIFDFAWADVVLEDGTIINDIVLPYHPYRSGYSWSRFSDHNRLRHMSCDEYNFNTMIIMLTLEIAMMTKYYHHLKNEKYNLTRILQETASLCVLIKSLQDAMKKLKLRSFTDITSEKVLNEVFKRIGWG